MARCYNLLGLLSCFILASSSGNYERLSDSRRLLFKDENTGKIILYEFEDLDFDGNVEVCVSGDPERKIKVYCYFSKEHADYIEKLTGFNVQGVGSYSSKGKNYSRVAEMKIMDERDQERANYLFTLADRLDR